jgi:protein phosphatase
MLTAPLPAIPLLRWDAVSRLGDRTVNADSTATHRDPVTGRTAFAVADGIGDSDAAARAAWLVARTAAEAAAGGMSPAEALLSAQDALWTNLPDEADGDAVLAIAVPDAGPEGHSLDVAWVGDARVYHWNGRILEQVTTDHTVAEYFRSRGQQASPRMEHMVTTSVRTAPRDRIGRSRTALGPGRLLVCSDGVHKPLPVGKLRELLDRPVTPETAAELLVDAALEFGGRDNTTALVVDHLRPSSPDTPEGLAA